MNLTMTMELRRMADEFKSRSEAQVVTETAVWGFACMFTLFGNLLTLIIVYKNPDLRTSTNMFVVSLAISDVGYIICSALPLSTPTLAMSKWPFSDSVCQYQGFIGITMVAASILNLRWTAVNRFYRVVKPAKYTYFFSVKRTTRIIFLAWVIAVLAPVPYLASGNRFVFHPAKFFCYIKLDSGPFTAFLVSVYIGIPATAIFYCYSRIYLVVRHHNAQISNTVSAEEIKITKILFVMVFAFMCCWTPVLFIDFIDTFSGHWIMPRWVYMYYNFVSVVGSSLNPVIYVVMNPQFRNEYLRLLRCSSCRNEVENVTNTVNEGNASTGT